jgi:acyl-CoA ligase (AMP-forming) (exosortase A-associated)
MPFEMTQLPDLLIVAADRWPNKTALIDRTTKITYADLLHKAQTVAANLTSLGIRTDDRVAVIVDKRIECVAAIFGCYLAKAILVPVNPQLKSRQIDHILSDSGTRLLMATADRSPILSGIEPGQASLAVLGSDGSITPQTAATTAEDSVLPEEFRDRGLATLFYTSGSTGLPKAVACTHGNILGGALSVSTYLGNVPEDVILAILPLSFDAGFSQLTTGMRVGATVVLQDYLLPADIARACTQNGVTGITGVPAIWAAAVKAKWPAEVAANIRYFANTGGHLAAERLAELRVLFPNARPFPMYGLTEAFRSTYLDPSRVDDKPGSIGKAIPGATVCVIGDDGMECADGVSGELVHAGPTVSLGYWKNPEETARRFRPSPPGMIKRGITGMVVYSGDLVRRDTDGFLFWLGRRDGLVKVSGNRISFTEIEDAALAHPAVRAAAAGALKPDPMVDPVLVLFVESAEGPSVTESLDALLRRTLPGYTVPSRIIVLDSLPLNTNNKYDVKSMLAELA